MTMQQTKPVVVLEPPRPRGPLRRHWRRAALIAAAVVLAGFLCWVLLFSSWLGVRNVEVDGAHRVSATEVRAAADVTMGAPLARVDLHAIAARVEAIPAVAAASVHRGWPHTVQITVTERQPVAVVAADGKWWLMDANGVLFAPSQTRTPDEPLVQFGGRSGVEVRRQLAAMLGVFPADLAAQTLRISAGSADSIELHLRGGREARWGSASQSAEKAAVLRALLHQKAAWYDVSVPSLPAVRG